MRAVVIGAGAVGSRAARQLASTAGLLSLTVVERDRARGAMVAEALGPPAVAATWAPDLVAGADVVILANPGRQRPMAEKALEAGAHVVSVADDLAEVRELLALDSEARARSRHLVVGAGFSPGLTCLLARHAAQALDRVDEVRVARLGTGGPSCAASRRRVLAGPGLDWRLGGWRHLRRASGRELCWFPDPVGGRDVFAGRLPDALLLAAAFPEARRVTARVASSRRERWLGNFPAAGRTRSEGNLGAVRVEVRGVREQTPDAVVLGAVDRPAVAAGAVAAVAANWTATRRLARFGAAGLAELVPEPAPFLRDLAERGVRAAAFDPEGRGPSGAGTGVGVGHEPPPF
ncbi:MAG: Gfo/Idh/MocA family oxidoreductase [Acidimicrobiales bacterium]